MPWTADWTLAPAAVLRDWLEENGLTPSTAVAAYREKAADRWLVNGKMIGQVLDRQPLTEGHARFLEGMTGISAQFWRTMERNYRADLAAGRKDVTEDRDGEDK